MQGGAPPHRARIITTYLNEHFPIKWIGYRSSYVQWPPGSPDLTPSDFYFWRQWKTLVYRTPIESSKKLVQQIRDVCDAIRAVVKTIQNATNTVMCRSELRYDNSGRYLKIFYSVLMIYKRRT